MQPTDVTFFARPADLRKWFAKHAATARELWAGFYKKDSGNPSITWPESVDEALCVGWIDGIRKTIDAERYTIRFTPRKNGSIWSAVNVRRAQALIAQGRMRPAGLAAFQARRENKVGIYSYEQRRAALEPPYEQHLRNNTAAWTFFHAQPPSYRKRVAWYIISAKKEETRVKRLEALIQQWARGIRAQ